MVLVIPIVILAIIGGIDSEDGFLDDIILWVTFTLLVIMAACLVVGWHARKGESRTDKPDDGGVL
tara:strand:+ start:2148 stop:2342 length:195 start_codon:yes stop_codon:yes gene_type:complete